MSCCQKRSIAWASAAVISAATGLEAAASEVVAAGSAAGTAVAALYAAAYSMPAQEGTHQNSARS